MSLPSDQDIMGILQMGTASTTQLCDRMRALFVRASTRFTVVGEPTLASIVGQVAGFASVCWSDIDRAGEFDSSAASAAVTQGADAIRDVIHGRLVGLLDQTGTAREWNEAIEAALKALEEL